MSQNRAKVVAKRLSEASELYRPLLKKAYEGTASPRQAIKAFCLQCVGYERDSITHCTSLGCPIFMFRPYQKPRGAE
jgi:hypothetical protein